MKRGFALLETIIVITFLAVSLLMLYGTFTNMFSNSKKNIYYDDASNIYKAYYVKEYLLLNNLESLLDNSDIKVINCSDLLFDSCNILIEELDIKTIYVAKYNLNKYNESLYSSNFNNYMNTLSNKGEYKYRLIIEFINEETYAYASIGFNGDENE